MMIQGLWPCHPCHVELLGDLLKQKPKLEEGVDNIIVVDNAPKVSAHTTHTHTPNAHPPT